MSRLALAPRYHANGAHSSPGSVTQHRKVSTKQAIEMIPSTRAVVAPEWSCVPAYGVP